MTSTIAEVIDTSATVRFLATFSATLLPVAATAIGLQFGWQPEDGGTWSAAGAVVTGWAFAVAVWLHHRGWRAGAVLAVIGSPVAVLAGPAALGWLTPAGAVLWGPVSTVLAAALVMAAQPPTGRAPESRDGGAVRCHDAGRGRDRSGVPTSRAGSPRGR